ncbi:hypothetical protein [Pontiella agarivorans]|uniref:CARDB domain-containing protein n=1 Tax=Pontiella agarivorans TaxID=3038953 RepID=A0ABU5N1C5_9BACT|nr:hypothetical protein [Pontiella agarivorans]MDZ8120253.1 hypothetical protein [Pontiella agarivorans]
MKKSMGVIALGLFCAAAQSQVGVPEGETLVFGGQFTDRFEPVPIIGELTSDTWGAENVLPRDLSNGIEDPDWSYWGGKILKGDDGKYHMFPCRWSEDNKRGHRAWMHSQIVHAVSENPLGPYEVIERLGPGHNPAAYRQADGSYVVYAFIRTEGRALTYYYRAKNLGDPWVINAYEYDLRGRPAYLHASNFGITRREDGACLAVDKKGSMLISQTGTTKWYAIGTGPVFPPRQDETTKYEDPALWYDGIQYHMLTHDYNHWEAYYLRSKDGVKWVREPGLGYGSAKCLYEDGTENEWWRYERVQVLQDDLGRAMQINFAALDVDKDTEKGNDNHNSKNVCIPMTVGRQLEVLNSDTITADTDEIKVKIKAEDGFNPHKDIDIESLHFGAAQEVNFGRGCKITGTEKDGRDLILIFDAKGHGFTADNFAGKLLGKTSTGKLLFGWSHLPDVEYIEPILSAEVPVLRVGEAGTLFEVKISNFGQVASSDQAELEVLIHGESVGTVSVPVLKPFDATTVTVESSKHCEVSKLYSISTKLTDRGRVQEVFNSKVTAGCRCLEGH